MRVLVTGGAGFIGSHVADRFVSLGHEVLVLDDLSGGARDNLAGAQARGVRLEVADLRSPAASAAVRAFAPEVVDHHAAQMDVRKSVADPAFDADVNLVGLLRMLEAARLGGALQHVVFASSGGAMYGEQDTFPATEEHAIRPESPYGLAKAVSEQYLAWYRRMYGIGYTALRYGNVYGPRQSPHGEAGVVAIFCGRILEGKPLTIFGDGKQTRDYVYVDDVVEANARALQQRPLGGFNIGTAVETDVLALSARLIEVSGRKTPVTHAEARAGEQHRSVIDPAAFARATGWQPTVAVADGLARTFRFFAQGRT
ncbi:MAG: GDP-mannose 4,6-dehydratase [Deltaproteobacteria bacterium]|nr:GDP-mannose 4,6-dehydratase [Deltaproteobacteria bacterium]